MDDLTRVTALYEHHESMDEDEMLREISELTDPIYSARMMCKVTGLPMHKVLPVMGKTAKTGGRLNPDTLKTILHMRTYGFDAAQARWCLEKGTAQTLLARLTGYSQSRISRAWRAYDGIEVPQRVASEPRSENGSERGEG